MSLIPLWAGTLDWDLSPLYMPLATEDMVIHLPTKKEGYFVLS